MSDLTTKANEKLTASIETLAAVSPPLVPLFARLGLKTVADLLFFFPRRYEDLTQVVTVNRLENGQTVSIRGVVEEVELRNSGPGRSVLGVLLRDETGYFRAVYFNQPFMQDRFVVGRAYLVSGIAKLRNLSWEMAHPRVQSIEDEQQDVTPKILPIYPLTAELKHGNVRKAVSDAIASALDEVPEVMPVSVMQEQHLPGIHEAIRAIHFPETQDQLTAARRRFVFQELFILQLGLAIRRYLQTSTRRADPLPTTAKIDARIRRLLPYEFTPGQESVIREITSDLARDVPMNRLLQGDVGSGKTVVAIYAMLVALAHGHQTLLMVPTEVLAHQHFMTIGDMLREARVRSALWTGALTAKQRTATKQQISCGEIDLVVGTQAMIQGELEVPQLGLVVIDEQHRFGVRQRARLRASGAEPHYLVMTATPIPRTVALAAYGDLDLSVLRDFPPGKPPLHTYLVEPGKQHKWWDFFREQLRAGRQGYVITPLVNAEDREDLTGVHQAYEALCNGELEAFRLDLVHGRMSSAEKQEAMNRFRAGETQVLVATSLVEVGVDVPNAAVMTIENPERFGLAQLHQLRGRVGRGQLAGYVAVFAAADQDALNERLQAFVSTSDGFELAELDFQQRGPGQLLGTQQHGLPPFRIANLARDAEVLASARQAAIELIERDPRLAQPQHRGLRRQLLRRYGKTLDLAHIG